MTDHPASALNIIGAAALLVADEMSSAVETETGLSGIAAAALISISHAPGEPIDFLAKSLRRSHSAVVRLVGTLADQGYLEKSGADDGRAVSLGLTRTGKQLVRRALKVRQDTLAKLFGSFSGPEINKLQLLGERLIDVTVSDPLHAMWICRLCDGEACDPCPMERLGEEA